MSDLIAVAYDDRATAEKVRDELARLTREHVIEIEDAVVVTREPTARSSSTRPATRPGPARSAEHCGEG
jgi:uncharacterized membrane protein